MLHKKWFVPALVATLVLLASVGFTLAYFTDEVEETHTLTMGNVQIRFTEERWVPNSEMVTNLSIDKDPTITVEPDSQPCYVRLRMDIDPELLRVLRIAGVDSGEGAPPLHPDFLYEQRDGNHYFVCTRVVQPGERLEVFGNVKVRDFGEIWGSDLAAANNKSMILTAEAIQSASLSDYRQAFSILDTYLEQNESEYPMKSR